MTALATGFSLRRRALPLLASLAIGALLYWAMRHGGLPIVPEPDALASIDLARAAAALGACLAMLLVRAVRWTFLLAPVATVPLSRVVRVSLISFGALVLLPLRSGELVRPALIARGGKVSGWAAAGTVGAERVIDGLFLSVLLWGALLIARPGAPFPEQIGALPLPVAAVHAGTIVALCVFGAALLGLGAFYWRRQWARAVTVRVFSVLSADLATRVADRVERVAEGLRFLPRPRQLVPFAALTASYWLLSALSVYLALHAAGLAAATPAQAMAVLGVLALGILTPNAPGLFGTFQVSLYAGLALFFPPAVVVGAGSVFVFLLYVLHVGTTLLTSAVALVLDTGASR